MLVGKPAPDFDMVSNIEALRSAFETQLTETNVQRTPNAALANSDR